MTSSYCHAKSDVRLAAAAYAVSSSSNSTQLNTVPHEDPLQKPALISKHNLSMMLVTTDDLHTILANSISLEDFLTMQAVSCSSQHASIRQLGRQSTSTKSAECFHKPGAVQPYGAKKCGFILDANTAQISIESSRTGESKSALSNTSLWNSESTSQLAAHQPSAGCVEGQNASATMHSGIQRQASNMEWSHSASLTLPLARSAPLVPPPSPTSSPSLTSSYSCMPPLPSNGSAYPPLALPPPLLSAC